MKSCIFICLLSVIYYQILLVVQIQGAKMFNYHPNVKINLEGPMVFRHIEHMPCGEKRVCDKEGIYEWWWVPKYKLFAPKYKFLPWDDYIHNPRQVDDQSWRMVLWMKNIPGSTATVVPDALSPDFRLPEAPLTPRLEWKYNERNRFYRISPAKQFLDKKKSYYATHRKGERTEELGCYCVCVYKRLTPLSMGAVLTNRHILTTAMATDLILRRYQGRLKTLNNILGAWYELYDSQTTYKTTNSSYYMTPVRIHYHPEWVPPERCNRSHPLPSTMDLALWTSKHVLWNGRPDSFVYICRRWTNAIGSANFYGPVNPPSFPIRSIAVMVGCQMVRDIARIPFPWFKYMLRMVTGFRDPCPKTEWGWFMCLEMHTNVGRLGADVGTPLHIIPNYGRYLGFWEKTFRWIIRMKKWSGRGSGLAGINSFSMKLRSIYLVNYFTVLDRWKVLNYLYDAYFGRIPYAFLDARFEDTKGAGSPHSTQDIPFKYEKPWVGKWNKYYKPIWW